MTTTIYKRFHLLASQMKPTAELNTHRRHLRTDIITPTSTELTAIRLRYVEFDQLLSP